VASFRKISSISIQLEVDGKHLMEPCDVADEFSKHFQSVYNNPGPVVFPTHSSSSEFLSLAPVSNLHVFKAIKRLRPSKSFGLDGILGYIIKGFIEVFVPALWKQAVIVPVLKKGSSASVSNYRSISLLNTFSKYVNLLFMMFRII
jgi:hypothetical protein